jgi:hypothetical protein
MKNQKQNQIKKQSEAMNFLMGLAFMKKSTFTKLKLNESTKKNHEKQTK